MKRKNLNCFLCHRDTSQLPKGSSYKVYKKELLSLLSQKKEGARPGVIICKKCEIREKRAAKINNKSLTKS